MSESPPPAAAAFRDECLGRFVDRLASDAPAPGGGAAAAVTAALAAALVAMVARLSTRQCDDAASVIATADSLREHALGLADEDAAAYTDVLAAYGLPKGDDPEGRRRRITEALERASDVPLEIVRVAAETAVLGSRLAEQGNPNLEGDATSAVHLARASALAAATLVQTNVRLGKLEGDWLNRLAGYLAMAGAGSED